MKTLEELSEHSPLIAVVLATKHGLRWSPPDFSLKRALDEIEQMRKMVCAKFKSAGTSVPASSETVGPAAP